MSPAEPAPSPPADPAAATTPGTAGTAARRAARQQRSPAGPPSRRPRGGPGGSPDAGPSPDASARRRDEQRLRKGLDPDTLASLEEEREFLLASLADLEREHGAGDVDDTDYAELRDDYTARAAAVLKALDERRALAGRARPPRSWGRMALGTALVALLAVTGGLLVARFSGNRSPAGEATGDIRLSSRDLLLEAQQYTGQATEQLSNGDTTGALESFRAAIETYQAVLELQPLNAEALTYQGWVLHTLALNVGASPSADELDAQARARLDEAVAADPGYADARVFRAILARNAGDIATAVADLSGVTDDAVPQYMTQLLAGLRQSLGVTAPPAAAPSSLPAG